MNNEPLKLVDEPLKLVFGKGDKSFGSCMYIKDDVPTAAIQINKLAKPMQIGETGGEQMATLIELQFTTPESLEVLKHVVDNILEGMQTGNWREKLKQQEQ